MDTKDICLMDTVLSNLNFVQGKLTTYSATVESIEDSDNLNYAFEIYGMWIKILKLEIITPTANQDLEMQCQGNLKST